MARRFVEQVFGDFIISTAAAYTADSWSPVLGSVSRIAVQVVTDKVTGTPPVDLTLRAEHSIDGINWRDVNFGGPPEIDRQTISTTATTQLTGNVAYSTPRFGQMRFRLTLAAAGGTPGANVKVYVTGRDKP